MWHWAANKSIEELQALLGVLVTSLRASKMNWQIALSDELSSA